MESKREYQMMSSPSTKNFEFILNPLDLLEKISVANDWPFKRESENELIVAIPGRCGNYVSYFVWQANMKALQFTCHFDLAFPKKIRSTLKELISLLNHRLLFGHFCLGNEDKILMFRYTLLLSHTAFQDVLEKLKEVMEIAFLECEQYYPAFFFVSEERGIEEAFATILEVAGEA